MKEYPEDMDYKQLQALDLQPMCKQLGYRIGMETNLISKQRHILWDVPWDYVHQDKEMKCHLYTDLFNGKGFIPSRCMDCWKVVAKPRTLRELFALRQIQRAMVNLDDTCYCKCGIEERPYVPGLYGGYFYNVGKRKGEEKLAWVSEIVSREIDTTIPVILKRYCTEMELKLGDSAGYNRPKGAQAIEDLFYSLLDPHQPNPEQPIQYKTHVYHKWMVFGWKFGSAQDRAEIQEDWNGGQPLYPAPRTY